MKLRTLRPVRGLFNALLLAAGFYAFVYVGWRVFG